MKPHTRSFSLVVTLLVVLSMALATLATTAVNAASSSSTAHGHAKAKAKATCKKQTKGTGLIKFSDWQFPDTLNPAQAGLAVDAWVTNATGDSLYAYDSKAKLYPEMATAIPTVKNGGIKQNGKEFIVHLKKGLHFSDGRTITSADVKFSWQIGMDKASGPACAGSCDSISRIDTPDKYTLNFFFKQPYAPAVDYAINGFGIYPTSWPGGWAAGDAHAAADTLYNNAKFNFEGPNFPTTGAYQVSQFVNNDRIVLTPMKHYSTMNCGAPLSQLIFVFYASKAGLIAAAASKQTDVTEDYTVADLPELNKHKSDFKTEAPASFFFEHVEMNTDKTYNGKANPLANTKVRQALSLGLDKIGLIQSALGISAAQAKQIVAWTPFVNTPSLVQPFADKSLLGQYDPLTKKYVQTTGRGSAVSDAKKLLSQAGYGSGFSLDFFTTSGNPTRQAQAAVIQKNWAAIGVKVNLNFVPASKLFPTDWAGNGILDHGQFQVAMFGYVGKPDPDQLKFNVMSRYCDREQAQHSSINGNNSCIHDSLINKLMPAAAKSLVKSTRAKDYAQVQVELNKQAYWIGLYFRANIATTDGKVKGFSANPTQLGSTWNVYAWKL